MQIETFKVFCDLVETASFSRAATLNSITQSAVSQQIRALERRFHVSLIERGKKNFSVTQEGRAFLQASKEILHTFESLGDRIRELQNIVAGELRIATIYSIGLHELPPFLKKFRALYPDVDVKVDYRRRRRCTPKCWKATPTWGWWRFPPSATGWSSRISGATSWCSSAIPDHPLAERKRVRLRDLEGEKFISFEPDLPTRKVIDRMLREQGVEIQHAMEFDNIETVKRAVEIENGISIVPADQRGRRDAQRQPGGRGGRELRHVASAGRGLPAAPGDLPRAEAVRRDAQRSEGWSRWNGYWLLVIGAEGEAQRPLCCSRQPLSFSPRLPFRPIPLTSNLDYAQTLRFLP